MRSLTNIIIIVTVDNENDLRCFNGGVRMINPAKKKNGKEEILFCVYNKRFDEYMYDCMKKNYSTKMMQFNYNYAHLPHVYSCKLGGDL